MKIIKVKTCANCTYNEWVNEENEQFVYNCMHPDAHEHETYLSCISESCPLPDDTITNEQFTEELKKRWHKASDPPRSGLLVLVGWLNGRWEVNGTMGYWENGWFWHQSNGFNSIRINPQPDVWMYFPELPKTEKP